jgi:hypothetical protein
MVCIRFLGPCSSIGARVSLAPDPHHDRGLDHPTRRQARHGGGGLRGIAKRND